MSHSPGATPARLEPKTITIADSMVLVVGVAVALALPWYNGWLQTPQPVMWPRWMIILYFFEEAVGKASLALIPHRSDGRNRPGIGGGQSGRYAGGGLAVKLHRVLAAVERSPTIRAARRAGGRCPPGLQRRLSHPASQCPMVCAETSALPCV